MLFAILNVVCLDAVDGIEELRIVVTGHCEDVQRGRSARNSGGREVAMRRGRGSCVFSADLFTGFLEMVYYAKLEVLCTAPMVCNGGEISRERTRSW